jgi:hypothetical protein
MFESFLLSILLSILLLSIWALFCNTKTLKQRLALLKHVKTWEDFGDFNRGPSYHKHLWMLMTLRNPLPMYGPLSDKLS